MFMSRKNILEYTPHSDQNGCVGVTYNFIPHKSTKFGNFLDFKTFLYRLNIVLYLQNIHIIMKSMVTQPTKFILNFEKFITSFWLSIPNHI